MEDRRNLFVIIFITFFVMMYVQWMFPAPPSTNQSQPSAVQPVATGAVNSAIAAIPSTAGSSSSSVTISPSVSEQIVKRGDKPSLKQVEEKGVITVNTGLSTVRIAKLGARPLSLEINNYKARLKDSSPYNMIAARDGSPLPLTVYADETSDDDVLYTLQKTSYGSEASDQFSMDQRELALVFSGVLPSGSKLQKSYVFRPGSYAFTLEVKLEKPSKDGNPVWLEWSHIASPAEVSESANLKKFSLFDGSAKLKNTMFGEMKNPIIDEPNARWAAIADYYFIESLISPEGTRFVRNVKEGDLYLTRMASSVDGGTYTIYAGPKELNMLSQVGASLERSVDLGVFAFLAHPILALLKFCHNFTGNYGLAIILLTLLIKLGFLPLTQTSFKSMKAMQDLQPEVQALRERISDPNILNQELMALYKKRGVNPLGGCLPIFIQIPVFLGLYNALLNSIELRHQPFALWINDLSAPESLHLFGIGVPLMILIMGASMFIQQYTQPSTMDESQKKVFLLMPIVFTVLFIIHPMPSGLVLYWLVNNLISIVQQVYIRGHKTVSPFKATAIASVAMFGFGYLLTLI